MKTYCAYLLVLYVVLADSLLTVRRAPVQPAVGTFYHSRDYFTNPKNDVRFCLEHNAVCESGTKCGTCKCNYDDLFFSYKHGCKSYKGVQSILKVKDCMYHSHDSKSLILTARQYMFFSCRKLLLPVALTHYKDCEIKAVKSIDIVTGMEVPINVSLMIDKEDQCLKCKHFVCDLTDIPGFFLNFDIRCVNKYTKFAAKTCFMFRVIGSFTTNESLPTISTSTKMVEMSTTITTATATITTTAMSTNATTMKLTSTVTKVQNNSTKATAKKMQTSTVIGTSTRHVSFSVKTKKSKANKKMNHNLAIFSAVGVVVIVLLLFVVLLIFYKRKKQVQSEKGCYVNEQASAGVGNENNGPVYSEMNDLLKSKTCEADVSMMKIFEETDSDELSTMENPYYMPTQCHNEFSNANCKENNIYNYACNEFSGNVKITAPSAHVTMSKSPEYTYITPVTSSNNPMYDVASFESTATVCSNSGDKTAVNEVYGI